jgi:hypothetical protein
VWTRILIVLFAALGAAGVGTLAEAHQLEIDDVTRIGPDLRVTATVLTRSASPRREN